MRLTEGVKDREKESERENEQQTVFILQSELHKWEKHTGGFQ